ncbi:cell wall-binding repeat-containing protein [Peribacillus acanthi]|uniref:cell wall-binding repeat-containing protein n=1 Tax=Peribacillus acanthi TaxID=2171554 RepID=UPI000D3E4899|nr:ArsR family transcriptional regulator [Peribacillus acanthi]
MNKIKSIILIISLISALVISACSNNDNLSNHKNMNHESMNQKEETKTNNESEKNENAKSEEILDGVTSEPNQNSDLGLQTLNTKNVTRLNTSDPIQAAILTSQTIFPATHKENQPGTVILVPLESWQTGLASADLIHHPNNGPMLFYTKDGIPKETLNEIKRLNPKGNTEGVQVMVMGNVDEDILNTLDPFYVENINGRDPAELAANVDEKYAQVSGGDYPTGVIIVSSDDESKLYSIPAINWISHMPEPVLFVSRDGIPKSTIKSLQKRKDAKIYLLGPKSVISTKVEDKLKEYGTVNRIEGENPVITSIEFAKFKDEESSFGWGFTEPGHGVSFVSTETPSLAIAAAPFSHLGKHAPLIWMEKGKPSKPTYQFLSTIKPTFKDDPTAGPYNHGFIIGKQDDISFSVQGILDDRLEIVQKDGKGHSGH